MKTSISALFVLGFAVAETVKEVDLLKKFKLGAATTIPSGNLLEKKWLQLGDDATGD